MRSRLLHVAAVLLGYTLAALWVTRPLLWHLRERSPVAFPGSSFDIPFNAWILSWVTRALLERPFELFSANIYHPAPDALAYTEHMLGSIPFFAPGLLATGNPAIALNGMILAGLVLSAAGAYWVTWRWTGSWPAATLAGLLFGFYPAHVRALGPNLQTLQYFPLILLCLDRVLAGGGLAPTLGLTVVLLGQCLASYYYAYPAVLSTMAATAVLCAWPTLRPSRGAVLRVLLALAITACVMVALSVPYFRVRAGGTHTYYSVTPYTIPPGTPWLVLKLAATRLGPAALLSGLVAIALGLGRGSDATTRRRMAILAAWLVVGLILLAGPYVRIAGERVALPGSWLRDYAPGYAALRDGKRLFAAAEAALAVLAGSGVAFLAARMQRARRRRGLAAFALATVGAAGTALWMDLSPLKLLPLRSGADIPPIYGSLARAAPGPLLELPVGAAEKDLAAIRMQTEYEYLSIFHRRALLNGYASYWPPGFETTMAMARALPATRALENLVACTGVRWILLHSRQLPMEQVPLWREPLVGLERTAADDGDVLYRVTLPGNPAACPAGSIHDARVSLEGTQRTPLPLEARRARIENAWSRRAQTAGATSLARLRVQNPTSTAWPGLGIGEEGLVRLETRWLDARGRVLPEGEAITRLPFDVRPGETVDIPVSVRAPKRPGDYQLRIEIDQSGLPFALEGPGAALLPVRVE